ncbi:transglutaminase-like domain-containing protein [Thiovibrio sp. JS02]
MRHFSRPLLVRAAVLILWGLLFGALLKRDIFVEKIDPGDAAIIRQSREESFVGIYFAGNRIGYVRSRLTPDEERGGLRLSQSAYLTLNILKEKHPVRMQLEANLSNGSVLRDFSFTLTSPLYRVSARGEATGNTIRFSMDTGKEVIRDSITLKKPAMLATNQRGYLLKQGLVPGRKVTIPFFDPASLSAQETVLEYRGQEKVLIKGRVQLLHHFSETFAGIRVNSWLDDAGRVIKEESPAGFVYLAEAKFQAMALSEESPELLSAVSAPLIGAMPALAKRNRMRYRLHLPEESRFDLDSDRQRASDGIVTISREPLPAETAPACQTQEFLRASPYIQADHREIVNLAGRLTAKTVSALGRTRILAGWVYENLEKKPVLGIPDALTTLRGGKGDCNEHAALFAALARSAGIPTKVVAGVTFYNDAFYYHAWNEVCIDGNWLSLDTTRNQLPADLGHIRFVEGETREMIAMGALLGRLTVEVLPPEPPGETDD